MPHLGVGDRVKETTTTTGTGTLNLDGAVAGFQTFVDGVGNGHETYYVIVDSGTGDYEVGVGTITDAATDTLSRDSVITSSNAGSLVNFGAGTKDVFCSLPSERAIIIDDASNVEVTANITATSFDGSGAGLTTLNASNLASGTLPDARFPATLPGSSGANLTNLNASNLASGTVPDARFPATLPAISGANLTNLDASDLASGTVPDARFPATLPAISGANLTNLNATNVASGTLSADRLPTVPTTKGGTGLTTIGTANQVLAVNSGGTALEYQTPTTGDITGVTAGSGLTGGGTTGAVTLNVGAGALIDVTADAIDVDLSELTTSTSDADGDFFVVVDSANAQKKLTKANINISGFNNDAGYGTGDITTVTAGNGLTGGGTTGAVTLNVGAGTGIDVAADTIAVDVSDFMTNGVNNRVVTATGTDAMNAEANMTFDGTDLSIPQNIVHLGDTNCYIGFHATDQWRVVTNAVERFEVNNTTVSVSNATLDVNGTFITNKGYIAEATLTDGATISWDMSTQSVAKVTLGGNRTVAAPTNGSTGQFASLLVIQDGTGSRTLTWNAVYEFASDTAPTLSTTGGKADLFVFRYNGTKWLEVGRNLLLTVVQE